MTGIETALIIAGTAVSAIGAIQQGNAAKAAANYNAAVARNNAIASRQNAEAQAKRQEREARIRAGANRAALGGSGVQLEGSVLDVLEDNAMEEELDRLMILHQGELQASNFESSANLMEFEGRQAQKAGRFKAFGTLAAGGAKAYGKWGGSSTSYSKVDNITGRSMALDYSYGQGLNE